MRCPGSPGACLPAWPNGRSDCLEIWKPQPSTNWHLQGLLAPLHAASHRSAAAARAHPTTQRKNTPPRQSQPHPSIHPLCCSVERPPHPAIHPSASVLLPRTLCSLHLIPPHPSLLSPLPRYVPACSIAVFLPMSSGCAGPPAQLGRGPPLFPFCSNAPPTRFVPPPLSVHLQA